MADESSLDRAALERVLARATELQARAADPSERLTEAEILSLGKEVGLSPEHLRQALAEERTRVALPEETTLTGRLFGPTIATAVRTVNGTPDAVLATLDAWMQRDECLQMKRRFPDRILWEPRTDFFSSIRRGFNVGSRGYHLSRASDIAATVVALDADRVMVRLDADMTDMRRRRVRESAGVATLGAASSVGFVGVSSMVLIHTAVAVTAAAAIAVLPVAVGAAAAFAIAKSQHGHVARMQLALEQVLDRLEHGDLRRPGPGQTLIDAIGTLRALR